MATKSRFPASLRVIGRSVVDWWDGWLDMVMVIIVWLFAQLTVVLGPPATFGLYYVVHSMINGEALGVRGLISGGRRYFGKAWIWGILNILGLVTLVVNYLFYGGMEADWGVYVQGVVTVLGFLWFCTHFYALPFFMEQENKSIKIALRNGILTTLAAPFFTIVLAIPVVLVAGLSAVFVIPIFLGLPGIIPFLGFRAMYNRLEAFGLRKPEKTPREIEFEESSRIRVPGSGRQPVEESEDDKAPGEITKE
jgi:uncharacterized membrane protein YesL